MNSLTINEICKDINKYSDENNILYTAINLTDYFFLNKFHGKECDLIQHEYAYHMCLSILVYLNSLTTKKEIEVHENKMLKFLNVAKEQTFKVRQAIFREWLTCVNTNTTSKNYVVRYLVEAFRDISLFAEVREELGLPNNRENVE